MNSQSAFMLGILFGAGVVGTAVLFSSMFSAIEEKVESQKMQEDEQLKFVARLVNEENFTSSNNKTVFIPVDIGSPYVKSDDFVDISEYEVKRIKSMDFGRPAIQPYKSEFIKGKVLGIEYGQIVFETGTKIQVSNSTESLQLGEEITVECFKIVFYPADEKDCIIKSIDKKFHSYEEIQNMIVQNAIKKMRNQN